MTTVNTSELKTHANRLLKQVANHHVVVITKRGHPCAALIPVTDENLADVLWEYSPAVQQRLHVALDELRAGTAESLSTFAKRHGLVS